VKPHVRSDWRGAILVCRKCGKKLGGGFGPKGKTSLAKALRKAIGGGKDRKAKLGVVEVGCLDICPKGGVTVVDTRRPSEWLIVEAGTPVEDVVERLEAAGD
jgi:predicted metal-binding protein